MGDTADTIALAFAHELNRGYTGVWASASGNVLTIQSRGRWASAGNANTLAASTTSGGFTATASGANFAGGVGRELATRI